MVEGSSQWICGCCLRQGLLRRYTDRLLCNARPLRLTSECSIESAHLQSRGPSGQRRCCTIRASRFRLLQGFECRTRTTKRNLWEGARQVWVGFEGRKSEIWKSTRLMKVLYHKIDLMSGVPKKSRQHYITRSDGGWGLSGASPITIIISLSD